PEGGDRGVAGRAGEVGGPLDGAVPQVGGLPRAGREKGDRLAPRGGQGEPRLTAQRRDEIDAVDRHTREAELAVPVVELLAVARHVDRRPGEQATAEQAGDLQLRPHQDTPRRIARLPTPEERRGAKRGCNSRTTE